MYSQVLRILGLWVFIFHVTNLWSVASPLPSIRLSSTSGVVQSDYETSRGSLATRPPGSLEECPLALRKRHRLHKRRLSIVHAERTGIIVPINVAVPGVKFFYLSLIACVRTVWQTTAPLAEVVFAIGNLHLRMSSASPIAWDFIERFSTKMLNAAALGFAGTYQILYADQETGTMVTITLRIVDSVTGQEVAPGSPLHNAHERALTVISTTKTPSRLPHSLNERVPDNLKFVVKGAKIHYTVLPTLSSIQVFVGFYELLKARLRDSHWIPSPSPSLFTVSEGAFQLTVSGLGGPVPLELLYDFAERMIAYARKGWLPLTDVHYGDDAAGLSMLIGVTILGGGLPYLLPVPYKRSHIAPVKPMPLSTLRRRSTNRLSKYEFSSIKFQHSAMITPVTLAASYLMDFYEMIATKIETNHWDAEEASHYVTFQRWNFELSFFCYAEAVPWDFIQDFVINMADYAAKGFTSAAYKARFQANNALADVFVDVWLRMTGDSSRGPGGTVIAAGSGS